MSQHRRILWGLKVAEEGGDSPVRNERMELKRVLFETWEEEEKALAKKKKMHVRETDEVKWKCRRDQYKDK